MKQIYLSYNLLNSMAYYFDELENPMDNMIDYDRIETENKNGIYYQEDEYEDSFYRLENVKKAYKQTEQIFDKINIMKAADDIENYLYSLFGESRKVYNVFYYYMKGKEHYAKVKTFWLILESMNNY